MQAVATVRVCVMETSDDNGELIALLVNVRSISSLMMRVGEPFCAFERERVRHIERNGIGVVGYAD